MEVDAAPRTVAGARMPRWVKAFGVVAALAVLVFIALHLAGVSPTGHGP